VMQYSRILMLEGKLPSLQGAMYLLIGVLLIFMVGFLTFSKLSRNIAEKI